MAQSNRITGILTPNIVPLDPRGNVDEQTLRGYVDWLIAHGVDGLYPNGSTGEFVRFTAAERREIARIVIDQAAGRVPVLVGAAEANVRETIEACDAYGEMGAQAVAIVAPYYFKLSDEGVYSYFREIADAVSVNVTLYNIPLFASEIDLATVRRLAEECPRVVGIKDSSGDLPHMMRMIAAIRPQRPEFSFLTGWDASLSAMLLMGADGGTNATSGVVPELTAAVYKACKAGDLSEAVRLQNELTPLFDTMIGTGEFPEGFRAGLRTRGWDMGRSRQPMTAAQYDKSAQTEAKVRGMMTSYTNGAVTSASATPESIDAIVRRVLSELKA
ncbi:putative 2-keto-3-deoxy-galactonate aldolase YagE [Rosistilla oblonga]|uniref:dihydrodipicolinate synthase family protein n=1 Tax=Rosistilla oblonga TaxID=2527990 RepID=UPI00118D4471|nr:dihydrodipicolinate synthase family protein [Rosistilla oblonga]QDV15065.1 putative 2-keto-3-deoxy-galactonate aldolase YagE [Rosistilla oblonga]